MKFSKFFKNKDNLVQKLFSKFIRRITKNMLGKVKYQRFFEDLNDLALKGMNIGGGAGPYQSGEKFALNYIYTKLEGIDNLVLFDVGANIGKYSSLIQEIFGTTSSIYSFEPSKKAFEKLTSTVENNGKINLFNFGFSSENYTGTLFSNHFGSGLGSVYRRRLDHVNISMKDSEQIELRTLDSFCSENSIERINLLKLDVEGHEMKVIEGSSKLLKSGKIDFIQFEFGGCNIDSRTFFQDFYYLFKDDYKIYRIVKDGLYPIGRYNEMYEAFQTTNYLAEKI